MSREGLATITADDMSGGGDAYTPDELAYLESVNTDEGDQYAPIAPDEDAPEPEAKASPEQSDDDLDDGIDDQPTGTVPKSAYLRVKGQTKELNERLAQVASELIRHRERQAVLSEMQSRAAQKETPAEPEKDISPDEDIFGAYHQLQKKLVALEKRYGESDTQTRQQIEAMAMQARATQDLQAFAAKQPEFMDGYRYLVGARHKQLEALGLTDEAQRTRAIEDEARELVSSALKSGQSAAERLWKLALASGYQIKPQEAQTPDDKINGEAKEQIERINKGQKANASLKNAGGPANSLENLTINRLAEMSDGDYAKTRKAYVAKYGSKAWDKLHGA